MEYFRQALTNERVLIKVLTNEGQYRDHGPMRGQCSELRGCLPMRGESYLLPLPDTLEAAVQPLADGELGHLLLDDVLQLLPGQQFLNLQSLADVH